MHAEIGQIQQRGAVVGDDVVDLVLIVFGVDRLQANPFGHFVLGVFLKKEVLIRFRSDSVSARAADREDAGMIRSAIES